MPIKIRALQAGPKNFTRKSGTKKMTAEQTLSQIQNLLRGMTSPSRKKNVGRGKKKQNPKEV